MSNHLPPSLIANLQSALIGRKGGADADDSPAEGAPSPPADAKDEDALATTSSSAEGKPVVLVTNADGIGSPGLVQLVEALVREGSYDVHVCAPEVDRSLSGHSVTVRETVVASSVEMKGAKAFEVSGTPVDCVSLALSGSLFSWTKPALVISGINKGLHCGQDSFFSGAIAATMEALLCGVPSLSVSLNWKKESQEADFKGAVEACLPLINAALKDREKDSFPRDCLLSISIPTSPTSNKGFKITKRSTYRSLLSWLAVSGKQPSVQYSSKHQTLGIQLAQLSRDASAAGAARRLNAQRKAVEIESVAAAGKTEIQGGLVKKYFRLELLAKEDSEIGEDLDFQAVEDGFISVTPLHLPFHVEPEIYASASNWLNSTLNVSKEVSDTSIV